MSKVHHGKQLKRIIAMKDMSVQAFADTVGRKRQTVYNWFEEATIEPVLFDRILQILKMSKNEFEQSNPQMIAREPQAPYFNAKLMRPLTGPGNMVIVPLKAFGGFLTGYASKVYLDSLERVIFPFVRGECFAFEVEGFSMMNDDLSRSYVPGSYVVCTPLESLDWMNKGKDYVFQTVEGIILKTFNKSEGEHCYLSSLNKEYEPIKVHMKKIKKVYHIEYKIQKP